MDLAKLVSGQGGVGAVLSLLTEVAEIYSKIPHVKSAKLTSSDGMFQALRCDTDIHALRYDLEAWFTLGGVDHYFCLEVPLFPQLGEPVLYMDGQPLANITEYTNNAGEISMTFDCSLGKTRLAFFR